MARTNLYPTCWPASAALPCPALCRAENTRCFPSVDALRHQFDVDFHGTYFKAIICPGAPSIGPGAVTAASGWKGQLACGHVGHYTDPNVGPVGADAFGVMWTNESRSFWGRVDGTNLVDLMDWFGRVIVPS